VPPPSGTEASSPPTSGSTRSMPGTSSVGCRSAPGRSPAPGPLPPPLPQPHAYTATSPAGRASISSDPWKPPVRRKPERRVPTSTRIIEGPPWPRQLATTAAAWLAVRPPCEVRAAALPSAVGTRRPRPAAPVGLHAGGLHEGGGISRRARRRRPTSVDSRTAGVKCRPKSVDEGSAHRANAPRVGLTRSFARRRRERLEPRTTADRPALGHGDTPGRPRCARPWPPPSRRRRVRDDPTVNRLEEEVARLLGKQAALYCATGRWRTKSRSRRTPSR